MSNFLILPDFCGRAVFLGSKKGKKMQKEQKRIFLLFLLPKKDRKSESPQNPLRSANFKS
jgi:hypothetical protein